MCTLLATSSFVLIQQQKEEEPTKPNIIYIMLDDAGYGDFEANGVLTPFMDEMKTEGMTFTNHYSGSSVCAPTRCVLMTGLDTGHARRRDNQAKANKQLADHKERGLVFLQKEDVTIAKVLQENGYTTGGIGKWGLGNEGFDGQPDKMGFDHWFGYLDQVHAHEHFTDHLWKDGEMIEIKENENEKKEVYAHDLFEKETSDFIEGNKDKPFFLYLAYTLPHGKYEIPHNDPAYDIYKDKPWSQKVKNYAAMITRADRSVGLIMQQLKDLNIDENTIVFYTSDNGPNRPFVEPLNSAGGLRGIKRSLYEGGIKAAMTVRWPDKIAPGTNSDYLWGMRDVFPTFCHIAGVEYNGEINGISVLPSILGQAQKERDYLYWEYHSPFQQAIRMGDWKAIRYGTKEKIELYDLSNDPSESKDISEQNLALVQKISNIMGDSRSDSEFWPALEFRKRPAKR